MQKAIVIGHLGRDVELRYTPQGDAVADFSIASTDKEVTTWFKVTVWRGLAEVCAKHLKKGSQVFVEGPLSVEEWRNSEGVDRYTLRINAQNVQFLGAKNETALANETESRPESEATKTVPAKGRSGKGAKDEKVAATDEIPF